ncbi:unnamed protein product [Rotaria magnacalcarata]|uniref:Clathrin light chain n=2 Tax=Rotaria magnacalcarata TaxID=392030 RepID=A0A816Q1C5_9BILA|nr:unnamed protein product [Rotaria magnacalcarata]CAF2054170.1 unnamed protein product [Rotaria magnacalcarata]CAF4937939.1 unnamed protein product [Rotaria magnacalcarata]
MDDFDMFTSKPSTTQENDLFQLTNTDDIKNNQNEDPSHLIENNFNNTASFSFDDEIDAPSSLVNQPPLNSISPQVEEIFTNETTSQKPEDQPSYNMFSNEDLSPMQILNKKREQEIAAKDAEEIQKIEELRQQARQQLDLWYSERHKQMEQKRRTMKTEENRLYKEALETSAKESCDWSKIIRLADFNDGKQLSQSKRDITRMKTCIFNAKRVSDGKKIG